jgi:hypothetical protein
LPRWCHGRGIKCFFRTSEVVRDTGIEPVTSSVSGKRSPAELIALGARLWRWRRESNPCARLCRPLPHHSATPPQGLMHLHLRADDGIRTRDPHLGKVMRYQLRYVRAQRTRSSPGAKHDDSPRDPAHTNPLVPCVSRLTLAQVTACGAFCGLLFVLVFDVVHPLGAGPVAQWKSVRFTRGRSLVRSQPGPPASAQVVGSAASLGTTRGPAFGSFMRPICGQVADWLDGGRSPATSRRRTSSGGFSNERLSRRRLPWVARQPHRNRREHGRAAVAQLWPIEVSALSVADSPGQSRRRRDFPPLEVA